MMKHLATARIRNRALDRSRIGGGIAPGPALAGAAGQFVVLELGMALKSRPI